MNLHRMLAAREAEKRPVRVVLVGAGKFGSMYLSQARRTPGIHVAAVADLAPDRARASLARWAGRPSASPRARSTTALRNGTTFVTDDVAGAISHAATEVVIDATGHPPRE
jgi:predicted homoserine dehydrogenase-like protein